MTSFILTWQCCKKEFYTRVRRITVKINREIFVFEKWSNWFDIKNGVILNILEIRRIFDDCYTFVEFLNFDKFPRPRDCNFYNTPIDLYICCISRSISIPRPSGFHHECRPKSADIHDPICATIPAVVKIGGGNSYRTKIWKSRRGSKDYSRERSRGRFRLRRII